MSGDFRLNLYLGEYSVVAGGLFPLSTGSDDYISEEVALCFHIPVRRPPRGLAIIAIRGGQIAADNCAVKYH